MPRAARQSSAGLVAAEQAHNGDGSYLSERLAALERASPFYYARLESDRAVTASMAAYALARLDFAGQSLWAPSAPRTPGAAVGAGFRGVLAHDADSS